MGYRLVDIELAEPLAPVPLAPDQDGYGIVARWKGRLIGFHLQPCTAGETLSTAELQAIADQHLAGGVLEARVEAALPPAEPDRPPPSLTVAICTRNRSARLERLLVSLQRARPDSRFHSVEVVVIDNGSTDATRETVSRFPDARYVHEIRAGLNFARNAALAAAAGELIAYLDDDVVVDQAWLSGLAAAWRSRPDAGGYTGLVLPYRLDTEAQLRFEQRGGFGRGFRRLEFRSTRHDNPLFPVGAGSVGAGCNMAFDRKMLIELGGFDEALDTGPPLPGGGDLDIFYRVLRSGRPMVYEPRYAVFHEHRETIPELRRQYWSWGLGMMAFLAKSQKSDPERRQQHGAMVRWWFGDQLRALAKATARMDTPLASFTIAELRGGIQGLLGEYGRSRARVASIRAAAK